jgi:hypothetical protein
MRGYSTDPNRENNREFGLLDFSLLFPCYRSKNRENNREIFFWLIGAVFARRIRWIVFDHRTFPTLSIGKLAPASLPRTGKEAAQAARRITT